MDFANERTYQNAVDQKTVDQFHQQYEAELGKVDSLLGVEHPLYIGKEKVMTPGRTFLNTNPANTKQVLGTFQKGGRDEAAKAIDAAAKAFPDWAALAPKDRANLFLRTADIAAQRKYLLAALMTLENGKNRTEAMADVDEGIDMMRYYAKTYRDANGFEQEMGRYTPDERTKSVLRPYGVWAVVSPFNFPWAIAVGMSTGAMVTGNTVVLKPASDTPLMAVEFARLLIQAGLPPGVLNVVTGPGGTIGEEFVANPKVAGMVFTGSYEVGMATFRRFNDPRGRPMIAEMGGKNAAVVTEHADLEHAAEGVMKGAFGYGGQKCSATSRVIVHDKVREEFLTKLVKLTKAIRVGDPTQRNVYMGPVINADAVARFERVMPGLAKDGAVLCGGHVLRDGEHAHGHFVEPTIVDALPLGHRYLREELFLPILCVVTYKAFDDAIRIANDVDYGLTAGIFSQDQAQVQKFLDRVEAGVVYANRRGGATTGAVVGVQPFGGWKGSSVTFKHAGGPHYLAQFLREQSQTRYL
jgi:1-pyrroline-5-carboxylate dehydrogenase